ncbi:MAG TPA: SIMPL domain-containing protein [Rubrivivax sp.]|nr:SIMPL domain-containing protein [Rubrivivax sp.]
MPTLHRPIGIIAALLLAAGLGLGGYLVGQGLERFRSADRSVTVKGLAEQDVEADYAIWTLAFRRAGNEFGAVQKALSGDRDRVVAFLKERKFGDDEIEIRPLEVQDLYAREYGGSNQPLRFQGTGRVIVKSARPKEVAAAALAVDPLIQDGVQLGGDGGGPSGPRYQLRGFNEIKAPLLAQATRNAREQAQKFAADAGATLGALRSANQGVITIGDGDGSQGGGDEGSARVKRLRVVSTFEYVLE